MNHKAPLLWIFLQCTAALFSFTLGENAVLKGKKRLCVYCSSISISFFPSLNGINARIQHYRSMSVIRFVIHVYEKHKKPKPQISSHWSVSLTSILCDWGDITKANKCGGQSGPEKREWICNTRLRHVLFRRAGRVLTRSSRWRTHNATSVWTIWKALPLNPRFTTDRSPAFLLPNWSHFGLCGPLPNGAEFTINVRRDVSALLCGISTVIKPFHQASNAKRPSKSITYISIIRFFFSISVD